MRQGVIQASGDPALVAEQLATAIESHRKLGYVASRRTRTTAVMTKQERFSFFGFLLLGWWYAMWHGTARGDAVYLSVDAAGHLRIRNA